MTTDGLDYVSCSICGLPFDEKSWDDHHTEKDGEDCHAECCPICNRKVVVK